MFEHEWNAVKGLVGLMFLAFLIVGASQLPSELTEERFVQAEDMHTCVKLVEANTSLALTERLNELHRQGWEVRHVAGNWFRPCRGEARCYFSI